MNQFNLSSNLARLRRGRKLTQEELAHFIGVTKAAVSKWENAQSTPDILLLPQLAAFFSVTIDELIGYEAQLSKEQIRHCYAELSKDFATLPLQEAVQKVRALAHRYFSCYPLLLQLCILSLNHFMLADSQEGRQILLEAISWCDRIIEYSSNVELNEDAVVLKAILNLHLGRAEEAIEALESATDPNRISGQSSSVLIQAYQTAGEMEKAKGYAQIKQYLTLLNLVEYSGQLLSLYQEDLARCEEIIRRTKGVIEQYQLQQLHPNVAAQFFYQAAVVLALHEKKEQSLEALCCFEKCVSELLDAKEILLHGDAFFDLLDTWIDRLPLGSMAPRDRSFLRQNLASALSHPAFEALQREKEFQRIVKHLLRGGVQNA